MSFSPSSSGRAVALALLLLTNPRGLAAAPPTVTIEHGADGSYTLRRDGQPFFAKGAGGHDHLQTLVDCGGNSIRTWGADSLAEKVDGKPLVERAQELGLTIAAGLWVEHERHGFNYDDVPQVQRQREAIMQAVRKYKDCPAILVWGLGNEMEGPSADGSDPRTEKIWKELNVLAGMIKAEDPKHPVMTVIAGAAPAKIKGVLEFYPNIDILGVNAYASGGGVGEKLKQLGWTKPFMLTEFGPAGHWEVPKTKWGAPIEPSSWTKAGGYFATEQHLVESSKRQLLGTYAFLWGHKQEVTSTWYGMFLESGEKLPSVDAMAHAWTDHWPANRSPRITAFKSPLNENTVRPGEEMLAVVEATDADGDPLSYEWKVVAESTDKHEGGDAEKTPPPVADCIPADARGAQVPLKTPTQPGAYRLFVTVRDGKGGASEDNLPFLVSP